MPDPLHHLLISASAGSGKTYQLVRRYLHLLALDQEPEGIAAMTFTRKAAGEFFNRILRRLAELAVKPDGAGDYFKDVSPAITTTPDFPVMLRRVTRRMHRLRLGTMDSFFASMAACFPLELGLPAGVRVMDAEETTLARKEALDALLERLYQDDATDAQRLLMEAYKQATFGAEEKTVDATLQQWAESGLTLWEDSVVGNPKSEVRMANLRGWGDLERIWGSRGAGLNRLPAMTDVVAEVRASFVPGNAKGDDMLEELCAQALTAEPGMSLPARVDFFLKKLPDIWDDLRAGNAELAWGKKVKLTGDAARSLVKLAETLMLREMAVRAERTRGLAAIMGMFAQEYAHRVRARGRLSFADVQRLLANAVSEKSPWLGAEGDLWFRMDGRFQHWLVDEFQDTSRTQWHVIGSLVDEVIQDDGGARSFFAVGDPKQSIYLWRQAEPDLFDDILSGYPADGARGLHTQPLSMSFRSAQPVLDAVNAVFGSTDVLEELMPAGCLKGFAFQPHEASKKQLTGHAALLSPPRAESKEDQEEPVDVVAALLHQITPLKRGLSCAILVRQNKEAQEMTEQLRALTSMEIVCESDQHPCTDNAVTLSLLSLLTLAAHPADTRALEHLKMTPLWPLVHDEKHSWRYTISVLQSEVFEQGYAHFMETWTPKVWAAHPGMDEFHARRIAQMADIAAEFDAAGNRDLDAFIEFAREYPLRTRGSASAIQVMTIHASKGLEFDVVILPTLDGGSMDKVRGDDLLVSRTADGVQWVLQNPPKIYAKLDATLNAGLIESERRAAFESLCRLYVAMTRAKRGLYMIAKPAPKDGTAVKESKLLRATLMGDAKPKEPSEQPWVLEWETGNPEWYFASTVQPESLPLPVSVHDPLGQLLRQTQPMPRRRTPSGEESFRIKGKVLFSPGREPGRRLGTLVHELFAEVAWLEPVESITPRWHSKGLLTDAPEAAVEMVTGVLKAPACAPAFQPLSQHTLLWRERPFDLVMDGEWVSGIVDRVLLDRDASGRFTRAWIIDFKTDEVPNEEAVREKLQGYSPQIALYREAVKKLTGLPDADIRASLIFTRLALLADC